MCARVKSGATMKDTQALWLLRATSFPSVLRVLDIVERNLGFGTFLVFGLDYRLCLHSGHEHNDAEPTLPQHSIVSFVSCHKSYLSHARWYNAHINPPKTIRPTPATSLFTPARLLSSNSFTTPCTIILRTLASAFVNISATFGLQSLGDATRLMSLV